MNEEEKTPTPETAGQPDAAPQPPKKKRRGRRAYLDDIRRGADGRYVYTGVCYAYDEKLNPRAAVIPRLWALTVIILAASIVSGCLSTPFTRDTWYVLAPLGFEIACAGSVTWTVSRISGNGSVMREYVRKQTFGALPRRCAFTLAFAAVGLIASVIGVLVSGTVMTTASGSEDMTVACILYPVLKAAVIACCILLWRYAASVFWKESAKKI